MSTEVLQSEAQGHHCLCSHTSYCMLNTGKRFPLVCHRKLILWDRLMIYLKEFLQQPARSSPQRLSSAVRLVEFPGFWSACGLGKWQRRPEETVSQTPCWPQSFPHHLSQKHLDSFLAMALRNKSLSSTSTFKLCISKRSVSSWTRAPTTGLIPSIIFIF